MSSGSLFSKSAWIARLFRTSGQCQASDAVRVFCAAAIGVAAGVIFLLHRNPFTDPQVTLSSTVLGLASLSAQRKRAGLKLESIARRRAPDCDSAVRHLAKLILIGFELMGAKSACIFLSDAETSREFKWKIPSASPEPEEITELLEMCTAGIESEWGLAACSRVGSELGFLVLDKHGNELRKLSLRKDDSALMNGARKTTAVSTFEFDSRWKGRIVFFDPLLPGRRDETALRGLRRMVRLFNCSYRTQPKRLPDARTEERNEIARDLHDGVTQSLIAAEMGVETLRRRGALVGIPAAANEILVQTQDLLRREVRKLRLQIEDLRSNSNCLLVCQQISELIQNFELESGIQASFIFDSEQVEVSAEGVHDLVQIIREALSNIRKHSSATEVEIRLWVDREVHLVVHDNGRGFDFSGKRSLADLEASGNGPRVIRERVRINGGSMLIESRPNWGTRLELTLPLQGNREGIKRANLPPKIGVRRDAAGKQFNVA